MENCGNLFLHQNGQLSKFRQKKAWNDFRYTFQAQSKNLNNGFRENIVIAQMDGTKYEIPNEQ